MSRETEKLAAAMRKLRASKRARLSAMDAAMSAFNQEFSPEINAAETNASAPNTSTPRHSENVIDIFQGTPVQPRPTARAVQETRVESFGTQSKFSGLMKFKRQTMMMAGSCAAALIAGMIILPNMGDFGPTNGALPQDAVVLAESESVKVSTQQLASNRIVRERRVLKTPARTVERVPPVVTQTETRRRIKTPERTIEIEIPAVTKQVDRQVEKPDGTIETVEEIVVVTPKSIETKTLPAEYETYNTTVEVEPSPELVTIPAVFQTLRETFEIQADGTEVLISSEVVGAPLSGGSELLPSGPDDSVAANVVTIERRVLKTASHIEARSVPAQYGTIERRTQVSPERAEWRELEPDPNTGERRYERAVVPVEYKTTKETVVLRQAGEELVKTPAIYETVKETIRINADGSTETLSSEVVPAQIAEVVVTAKADTKRQEAKVSKSKGGIISVDSLLNDIKGTSSNLENSRSSSHSQRMRKLSAPRPAYTSRGSNRSAALSDTVKPAAPSEAKTAAPSGTFAAGAIKPAIQGQFTIFNGVSNQVVESTETIVNQTGEILCRVLIPARYKTITKQIVVSPARTENREVPAVTKDVTVKVKTETGDYKEVTKTFILQAAHVDQVVVPAVYETRSERVLVEPAREEWKPGNQAINAAALGVQPAPDVPVRQPTPRHDQFEDFESNPVQSAEETPVSTFSVDVDTASYSFLRASVNSGRLPPRGAVRLEEMINYFPYDYEAPNSADEPFKANVTLTPNPWNAETKLMHIGIKGYVPKQEEKLRNNLVFLIDTSGSMNQANKLPLLISSFKLLLNTLDADDTVSIVAYASASGTVLEPTEVRNKEDIFAALNKLRAHGSTAGAAGLQLAYQKAEENFDDEGVNRVILATDGDFNVGFSSPDDMKTFISKKRDTGISLSVLGFGMGNYNDHLMQSLAQNGNGVAAYIDSLAEANKVLANEAGSSLINIAEDVKIQVEFNPSKVEDYRLIGYETRALNREDFNDDKVDAAEIGAGHSVTAIYEVTPVDTAGSIKDKLRYVSEKLNIKPDEYAFVKIRHKLPNANESTLQTFPINSRQETSLNNASDDMRFAAAVAAVGQILRGDVQLDDFSYQQAIELATEARGEDKYGYRAEFIQMVRLIESLGE